VIAIAFGASVSTNASTSHLIVHGQRILKGEETNAEV
jgi:hypothetical protein